MKQNDIETELDFAMGIEVINRFISRIEGEEIEVELLYQISIERKDKVGFHAAWILEKLCEKEADYALFFIDRLMIVFNQIENKSTIRQYAKLLSNLLKLKNKKRLSIDLINKLDNGQTNHIIETCFEQIIDSKTQFSVKQMCCEVLLNYIEKEVWIKDELEEFCKDLSLRNTPSAQSYRRKLKAKLNKYNIIS